MGEQLATAAELRVYLNAADVDPDVTNARSDELLTLVSGHVLAATNRETFDPFDDTMLVNGTGTMSLLLPWPLLAVTSIVEDPRGDTPTTLADDVDYEWDADGIVRRRGYYHARRVWAKRLRFYEVTCSYGYTVLPDAVKSVVLRAAARAIVNPEGLNQETAGALMMGYGSDHRGTALSDTDLRDLEPFRL